MEGQRMSYKDKGICGDELPLPRELRPGGECHGIVPTRKRVVNAYADWLQEFPLSSFVTFTWSNEAVTERYIYTDRAAVNDVLRFLREANYRGQYFGVIEDHMHRDAPHAHVLMENCTDWRFLWSQWKKTRGFFCSRPAQGGAFHYTAKYCLKDGRCGERIFERLCRP
jgi:hypothetical protein